VRQTGPLPASMLGPFPRYREGGGEVVNKIGRGAHLLRPKSFSCFWALFLKAGEAPLKKRKRSETTRPQFWFWIKIRVNPIYLVFFLWLPPLTKPLLLSLVSEDRMKDILLNVFPLFPFWGARWCQKFSAPSSCLLMLISV
jgi:hypothetical protein